MDYKISRIMYPGYLPFILHMDYTNWGLKRLNAAKDNI